MRLTRAQHDFDVSATKISTSRFSTTLISVEYLTTVDIHSIGHQPLKQPAISEKFASVSE